MKMLVKSELTETFIEVFGDAERAAKAINEAMGTRHHRRKIIEWKNGVTPVPAKTAELMRWHVIYAVLDKDVAEQLCPMLDIYLHERRQGDRRRTRRTAIIDPDDTGADAETE